MPWTWSAWAWVKTTPSSHPDAGVEQLRPHVRRGVDQHPGRGLAVEAFERAASSAGGGSSGSPDRRRPSACRPAAPRPTSRSRGWWRAAAAQAGLREQAVEVRGGLRGERCRVEAEEPGDDAGGVGGVRGLVALAAVRLRREVRAVGLYQQPVAGRVGEDGAELARAAERGDAGHREIEAEPSAVSASARPEVKQCMTQANGPAACSSARMRPMSASASRAWMISGRPVARAASMWMRRLSCCTAALSAV